MAKMTTILKMIGIGVGALALIFLLVMMLLTFTIVDIVANPDNMRFVETAYNEETKIVQVKSEVFTSSLAPTHIYDISIKQKGDRVIIKARANTLALDLPLSDIRDSFDIPIEVGDSINYIQLGRRKKYTIWSREEQASQDAQAERAEGRVIYAILSIP